MEILLFWLLISVGVGMLAARYCRNPIGWFVLAVLLSPLVGFVWLLALGPGKPVHAGYQPSTGERAPDNPPNQGSAGSYRGSRFRPAL